MATDHHYPKVIDGSRDGGRPVSNRRSAWPLLIVKAVFAAAILAWLCTGSLDLRQLAHVPDTIHLAFLVCVLFVAMLLPALRWWCILRIQQIDASIWQVVKLTWVGYLTALLLPGAASGDVAKGYLILRQQTDARARSLSTVLVDRFVGIYSLILLGCLSATWYLLAHQPSWTLRAMCYAMFALLAGATIVPMVLLLDPVRRILARYAPRSWVDACGESYERYRRSKTILVGCLLLSLVSSTLTSVSLAAADRALGGSVSWTASLLVGPLVVLANCLPITPGGIGIAEAAASELFQQVGSTNGAEMMLAIRLVMTGLSLPALLILFGGLRDRISTSPQTKTKSIGTAPAADEQPAQPRAA